MPTKNNHINVNVKNVIKLDHNKKKTRHRRKNKNNKNIMPLARPNNSVYDPNGITFRTGGSIQYPTINKSGYDMKPRIGFGVDPNSDTTSTNISQQLLLEFQKQNDDKTNKMFSDYNKKLQNAYIAYHNNYYEPLVTEHNNLQTDFDRYKTNNYKNVDYDYYSDNSDNNAKIFPSSILSNNDTKNNAFEDINNTRFEQYNPVYNDVMLNDSVEEENLILASKNNEDNLNNPEKLNPLLTSDNSSNFSPPPFENFLNDHFNVEKVDKEETIDEEETLNKKISSSEVKKRPKSDKQLQALEKGRLKRADNIKRRKEEREKQIKQK